MLCQKEMLRDLVFIRHATWGMSDNTRQSGEMPIKAFHQRKLLCRALPALDIDLCHGTLVPFP